MPGTLIANDPDGERSLAGDILGLSGPSVLPHQARAYMAHSCSIPIGQLVPACGCNGSGSRSVNEVGAKDRCGRIVRRGNPCTGGSHCRGTGAGGRSSRGIRYAKCTSVGGSEFGWLAAGQSRLRSRLGECAWSRCQEAGRCASGVHTRDRRGSDVSVIGGMSRWRLRSLFCMCWYRLKLCACGGITVRVQLRSYTSGPLHLRRGFMSSQETMIGITTARAEAAATAVKARAIAVGAGMSGAATASSGNVSVSGASYYAPPVRFTLWQGGKTPRPMGMPGKETAQPSLGTD